MDRIGTLFGNRAKQSKPRRSTERGDLLDTLLGRLNPPRIRDGYKPLTYSRLSYLLTNVLTKDLYALISSGIDAERRGGNFSKYFWYAIKPKENK